MKIVVVGGGSSGWMTASWLNKFVPNSEITLVESPAVPRIGVGESVTVHLTEFIRVLGIDEHHFMFHTGSVYKYGNNFINWLQGKGENELFTFAFNKSKSHLYSSPYKGVSWEDHRDVRVDETRLTDYWLELFKQGKTDRNFSKNFTAWTSFTEELKAPFVDGVSYLPKNDLAWAYHINTERFADYLKEFVASPGGVVHKVAHIKQIVKTGQRIEKIIFDDDTNLTADLYVDCSGFHRVLVKEFDNVQWKWYENNVADSAYVCQLDYIDPEKEMVNYTKSIAMNKGWCFDISLFHRRGTGYIFSNDFISDDEVLAEYRSKILTKPKFEPRRIKWDKKRMLNPGFGNVCAIGMTIGFVEPMEANMLGVISNSAWELTHVLEDHNFDISNINWTKYNTKIGHTFDDVADFILVHYTLSPRTDNEYWEEMRSIGRRLKHEELLLDKYNDYKNTIDGASQSLCFFPDYMWIELAATWNIDLSKWPSKKISDDELRMAELHFDYLRNHLNLASKKFPQYYHYLKDNIFKGMTPQEWMNAVNI